MTFLRQLFTDSQPFRDGEKMFVESPSNTCKLLNIAMVVKWPSCLPIMENLRTKSSRLRLVAVAVEKPDSCNVCDSCYVDTKEMEVFEGYRDLLALDHLDLILELTGDEDILVDLIRRKKPNVGVVDLHASMLLFDMVPDVTLESPLISTLMEASTDGVIVIDRDYRIINCNTSKFIPGSSDRNSILGKHCFEVVQRSSVPCEGSLRCPAQETQVTGKLARSVYEIEDPDQTTQICQVTAYPVFNLVGEVAQCVLSIRDMSKTLSDKIEERTQAVKENLARVVREDRLTSLGRLVASVCHEINNPMASIVTFTKLILTMIQRGMMSGADIANIERYLELSFREGMRCGSIVKNLLIFARPESTTAQKIDINEMVETTLLLTTHQLELARIECIVDLPSDFFAWGDCGQIQQCLLNLIFNAIDAMPEGGTITISGSIENNGNMLEFSVSDTGHGIEPHHLARIFEPFFSTKSNGKGVGLGLSMVYGIVREHKGEIEVDSEPGKGTKFTIKLPTRQADH